MINWLLVVLFLGGCSANSFRRPTPLPASGEAFCQPHFDQAFDRMPKNPRRLNKTKYNYDALNTGLANAATACYQDYIEKHLDRQQGKVACVTFLITPKGIDHIEFAEVGVYNPPQAIKDCTVRYLKSAKSNFTGKDSVFIQQPMMFFTRAAQ